jgi:membrane-bound serine protease (ClpP class)
VIPLAGEIDEYTKDAFERRFEAAKRQGAKVIIVRFDTYGGLVTSGLDLSRFIKKQTTVHTIAFVDDKAISAGAMIAMACDQIVMCPDGSLGDCAPIAINPAGQLEALPATERAKMESPILADFEDSATRNGHDPLLAHAMVSVDTTIYWLESPDHERRFVLAKDRQPLLDQGWKPVDPSYDPLITEGHLLTVNTALAIRLGLASPAQAVDVDQLATQQNLDIIARLEPSAGERLIDFLNQGPVRMVLLIVLALAIYIVLHAPGHGLAEAVGVIALGLLLGIPLLTGYATWWEIVLIFAGLAVMAIEIFVLPHAGMLLVSGGLMMAVGFVLTFAGLGSSGSDGFWPRIPQTWILLQYGLMYVVGALVASMAIAYWISRYLPSMPVFNRLVLTATSGGTDAGQRLPAGWPPVGAIGRTLTPLRPGGTAEFFDEVRGNSRTVVVSSESGYVAVGASVIVREVDSSHVKVRVL